MTVSNYASLIQSFSRTSLVTSRSGEIISPVLYVMIMIVTITQMFGSSFGFCSDDFRFPYCCLDRPTVYVKLQYTAELTIECCKTRTTVKSIANQIKDKFLWESMGVLFKNVKIAISAGNRLSVSRAKFFSVLHRKGLYEVSGLIGEQGKAIPKISWITFDTQYWTVFLQ